MIMSIIDGINRFLGYLNISQVYLNRLYTIIATIPIFYILDLSARFYKTGNKTLSLLYLLAFLVFLYFLVLNFLFYFLKKNSKMDITQYVAKVLPDEAFDLAVSTNLSDLKFIEIDLKEDVNLNLFAKGLLAKGFNSDHNGQELTNRGFVLPYYQVKKGRNRTYIKLSTDGRNFSSFGGLKNSLIPKEVNGVFLFGGNVLHDGVLIKEPYKLKIGFSGLKKE